MRLFRSATRSWTEGKGYQKRPLITEEELKVTGTFVQEVRFSPGQNLPLHYHKQTREVFIALDPAEFLINGKRVNMEPMDVLICEPGDIHGNPEIGSSFRILVVKLDNREDDTVWL